MPWVYISGKSKIVRLIQTTIAAPCQWEAWDSNSNRYYIRGRRYRFEVTIVPNRNDWMHDFDPTHFGNFLQLLADDTEDEPYGR